MEKTIAATIRNYRGVVAWSHEKAHKVPLASSDRSRANLWCLKPGQGIHPHVHNGDHVWVVLEGTGDYIDGEDRHQVAQGDVLFVPAGLTASKTRAARAWCLSEYRPSSLSEYPLEYPLDNNIQEQKR